MGNFLIFLQLALFLELLSVVSSAPCDQLKDANHYHDPVSDSCLSKKAFGTSCESHVECDTSKMLACVSGSCTCFHPPDMEYDEIENLCKIKIGSVCYKPQKNFIQNARSTSPILPIQQTTVLPDNNETEDLALSEILATFSTASCIHDIVCSQNSRLCACPLESRFDPETKSCIPHKNKGSNCSSYTECNPFKLLSCVEDVCDCDPEIAFSTEKYFYAHGTDSFVAEGSCVGKSGTPCSIIPRYSGRRGPKEDYKYCNEGAECVEGFCQCLGGSEATSGKLCGLSHGIFDCSVSRPCNDWLTCTQDSQRTVCDCPNKKYQFYDPKPDGKGSCRGYVGTRCELLNPGYACPAGASCVAAKIEGGSRLCECDKGFVENDKHTCDIDHSHSCSFSKDSLPCAKGLNCRLYRTHSENASAGMVQVCSCPNLGDVYEQKTKKCVTPIGVACVSGGENCVPLAKCRTISEDCADKSRMRCRCNKGFKIDPRSSNVCIRDWSDGKLPKCMAQEPDEDDD